MTQQQYPVSGTGLGLRREKLDEMLTNDLSPVDFMEVAPENWIHVGGTFGKKFRQFTEKYDFICHGLSLSIGSPAPLDEDFVKDIWFNPLVIDWRKRLLNNNRNCPVYNLTPELTKEKVLG